MSFPITIPVAAHRLFGTKYVSLEAKSRSIFLPQVDFAHGTRRSVEEIRELFYSSSGWNVNWIWEGAGIRFFLVGVVDEAIESASADFIPVDARFQPALHQLNLPRAVNIYFCRALEGAMGWSSPDIHPDRPGQRGRVAMGDDWHVEEGARHRGDSWRRDVIVLAHELGHALTLPHMQRPENLMYGGGTGLDSVAITPVQALIAKQHGRRYAPPWFRSIAEIPHAKGYLGERIPEF